MHYMEAYNRWVKDDYFDEITQNELKSIAGNEKEIEDRFFRALEFGTGGLRGVIGAGTNRINIYTVRMATQGLANYIIKQGKEAMDMGVAIAYDSRTMSPEFAREAALVLNGNNIKAYLYPGLRPTPALSFTVRELGATAGIVITASHNPKEYNGYKVYWQDGGQVPYPRDEAIIAEVNTITDFSQIKTATKEEAGLFNIIDAKIDDAYISNVKAQSLQPEMLKKEGPNINIVYTPLHGSGNIPVRRVLSEMGFTNVHVVKEQEEPDASFSTVPSPNPDNFAVFKLALELAQKTNADLILGTDPDADRVGAIVKNNKGNYELLTGNMIGVLIAEYILSMRKASGSLPENGAVISTIVSTDMVKAIAAEYGITYMEVLTGFKYIGEKIKEFEKSGSNTFLFGFEESYGYLTGTYARDKDAVAASLIIAELTAHYRTRGMSLYEGLDELYKKYGYYLEHSEALTLKGIDGLRNIEKIMSHLRNSPPSQINKTKITKIRDYQKSHETGLPKSNVMYFVTEDETWIAARPSGTEPKIKIYFGVKAQSREAAAAKIKDITNEMMAIIEEIIK